MKINFFSVLLMLCAYVSNLSAHNIRNAATSSKNYDTDNVGGMATDAAGNTYVMQNLYYDYANSPDPSVSLSGHTGTNYVPGDNHGAIIIDKVSPAGVITHLSYVSIATWVNSDLKGTAIKVSAAGVVYVTGFFQGSIVGKLSTTLVSNNGSYDAFLYSFDATTGNVIDFVQQGGDGQEYATGLHLANNGLHAYITGYYNTFSSTLEQSDFVLDGVSGSPTVTAPQPWINDQNNSFVLRFSTSTLECDQAYGFATLIDNYSSFTPRAIIAQSNNFFITGSYTGEVELSSTITLNNFSSTSKTTMFVARASNATGNYSWADQAGTIISGHFVVGGNTGTALYDEGGSIMVTASLSSTAGVHNGDADAVLMRYSLVTSAPAFIYKAWEVHMGGNGPDYATSITNDGTGYVIGGYCNSSGVDYNFPGGANPSVTVDNLIGANLGFVASFSTTGDLRWIKYAGATKIQTTAVSANQRCYISFGGFLSTNTTWDEGTVMGTASPANNRLFFGRITARDLVVTPAGPSTVTRPALIPYAASGATSYSWSINPSVITGVSLTNDTTSKDTLVVASNATLGVVYVNVNGYYTYGGEVCTTTVTRKVTVITGKTDGTEVATSIIDDANAPMLTFNTFPNPTSGSLTISYSLIENQPAILQAVDLLGRVVYEKQVSAQYADETLDTDTWSNGMYVVTIQQNGKVLASKNVLKQ